MVATLADLTTQEELDFFNALYQHINNCHDSVRSLDLDKLSCLGLVFLKGRPDGKVPSTCLGAYAIEELTKRAIENNLAIF